MDGSKDKGGLISHIIFSARSGFVERGTVAIGQ